MADHDRFSILAVDDDDDLRGVIARRFLRRGHDIEQTASPVEALRRAEQKHFDVAILDIALPEMDGVQLLERLRQVDPETQVIMLTAQGTVETAIRAMKLGAYDYLIKPCELAQLELQAERAYEKARLARENRTLKAVLRRTEPPGEIIGTTPVVRRVLCLIAKVAPTDSSVLIQGESGTGKEFVARALHRGSPRADKPMVVINCAALQESLLENELFGHEKGAFTSAVTAKPGLFELADGGTLFIDEIGEMAPRSRPSCCGRWRTGASAASARPGRSGPMSGSSRRPTRTWPRRWPRADFATTSTIGSTSSRSPRRRCGNGSKMSRSWCGIS